MVLVSAQVRQVLLDPTNHHQFGREHITHSTEYLAHSAQHLAPSTWRIAHLPAHSTGYLYHHIREGLPKKVAVLLDFVQITSTPLLLPLIWTTCTIFFERQCAKKIGAGVSPSLPIPKLTQYIQFVKSGQKIWAGPSPPLIWTKSKRTATFFREAFPNMQNQVFFKKLKQEKLQQIGWA